MEKSLMMRERERESIGIPLNAKLVFPLGSQLIIIIIIITYIRCWSWILKITTTIFKALRVGGVTH